ncbi:MAG: hypothetical protein ACP5U2_05515 [Bryobacteraceae bacterium]
MFVALLAVAVSAWVPARWSSLDPGSLDLLEPTPVNCLLVEKVARPFVEAAASRGVAVLRVARPGDNLDTAMKETAGTGAAGLVLEGAFPESDLVAVRDAARQAGLTLIELPPRSRLRLRDHAPVSGTFQGLWPGIRVFESGAVHAAPTGGPWLETNTGFLRYLRAATSAPIWIANTPTPGRAMTPKRYLHAIADAAIAGARWVVALDPDFDRRLHAREPKALSAWQRIGVFLKFYEDHAAWREWKPAGRLALIQDEASGALLSGGILDMIAVRHVPVRVVPRARLTAEALQGARLAVNVDPVSLSEREKEALRSFTRAGGTLLSGPPGWKFPLPQDERFTLEEKDLQRLDEVWREVNSLLGRRNLGVRLFNVAGMLSNLLASPDGRQLLLHLANFTDYPAENITVHVAAACSSARLLAPGEAPRALSPYPIEEGVAVEIERIATAAALLLDCKP